MQHRIWRCSQLNPDYKTVLNYATQAMTATIVNAKADYLIKNMHIYAKVFQDNGLEGVELQWWGGATTFKETFTAEDSMTPAMDFQDSLDDIEQEPVDRAATAYDGDEDDDLTTTDDENDNGDEEGDGDGRDGEVTGKESDSGARDGGGASGMGGGVLGN